MLDRYKHERPYNTWESMHPLVRWTVGAVMVVYLAGALVVPLFWLLPP